ncbi:MAG: rod-binding protein [Verrucomicrobia bacterium]|nr:rod-binding protein [Verrucomicrobiota bacterium]
MNVAAINSSSAAAKIAAMQTLRTDLATSEVNSSLSTNSARDPAAIKKVAASFEAIILRQLLAPAIEPMMSGGMGGGQGPATGGGGVYGYMLTDTLANSLSQGGGFGLARMLEKQFTPRGATTDITDSGQAIAQQKT